MIKVHPTTILEYETFSLRHLHLKQYETHMRKLSSIYFCYQPGVSCIDPSATLSDVSIYSKDPFLVRSRPSKSEVANAIGVFEAEQKKQAAACGVYEHHYHPQSSDRNAD
jgi:hypothetical protein